MSYSEAKTILRNNMRTEWQWRLDIGTEEDSTHQLDRAAQVTFFRLRTGHCQLLFHLHRLNISHSDECACGTGPQTPNHILQSCPAFDALRGQTWRSPKDAHSKLWGPVETLRQTADFVFLTGLKILHDREHRRRRRWKEKKKDSQQNPYNLYFEFETFSVENVVDHQVTTVWCQSCWSW